LVFPRETPINAQPYDEERGRKEREKAHEYEREFNRKFEAQRKSNVDVPKMYDDLHLNLGAERHEKFFDKAPQTATQEDQSINDPKVMTQ